MAKIYLGARKVLAWIGDETVELVQALHNFHTLADCAPRFGIDNEVDHLVIVEKDGHDGTMIVGLREDDAEVLANARDRFACIGIDPVHVVPMHQMAQADASDLSALITTSNSRKLHLIYEQPWFCRIWIVQEIISAQDISIYCGKAEISWKKFAAACFLLSLAQDRTAEKLFAGSSFDLAWNVVSARAQRQLLSPNPPIEVQPPGENVHIHKTQYHAGLLAEAMVAIASGTALPGSLPQAVFDTGSYERYKDIVSSFNQRQCKDDRDRIFGMLGFMPWDVHLRMTVDYSKTVVDVYTDYARAMLGLQKLEIFNEAGLWSQQQPRVSEHSAASPSSEDPPLPSWVPEHRVPGTATVHPLPWHPAKMNTNWGYCPPVTKWPINPRHRTRVFVEGVRLGSVQWSVGFNVSPASGEDVREFLNVCLGGVEAEVANGDRGRYPLGDQSTMDAFAAAFVEAFPSADFGSNASLSQLGRCMFLFTREGYMGYSPGALQMDDVLVAFCGLPGPYVVRPVAGTLDFHLLGPCFVYGMMDGRFEYGDDYQMVPLI